MHKIPSLDGLDTSACVLRHQILCTQKEVANVRGKLESSEKLPYFTPFQKVLIFVTDKTFTMHIVSLCFIVIANCHVAVRTDEIIGRQLQSSERVGGVNLVPYVTKVKIIFIPCLISGGLQQLNTNLS